MADGECGCGGGCSRGGMHRRDFLAVVGAAGAAAAAAATAGCRAPVVAGPFPRPTASDHFVPADKRLTPEWLAQLFAPGESTWYEGDDLRTIGMPVGGICAGQVYLTGDGRLACWDVFNANENTGSAGRR